jgi:RNA polymerase sigma-70 factor (sigma-E family)
VNEGGFETFVATRYNHMLRAARMVALDATQAEDLLQAALIRTFTKWSSLHSPLAAESYTQTTLVRLAMRAGRRRWRGERPTAQLPEVVAPDEFAMRDDTDAVRRALATLPLEQRAVLVLRYYVQLSEAEIAWALRCPPGTVKSRAHQAIAALRASGLLSPYDDLTEARDE